LWQDAYLAAFARAAKLHLVTFDGGFRQYEGLRLTLLGD
jgi:predicted nucleic acid-binding protein